MNIVDMRGKMRSKGSYVDYGAGSKTHIIVHHSLTKTGSAEAYARYHVDTLGWPGIGYHFVIEQDGTIKQNHSIGVMSYHVGNHNKYCVGICLTGDFRTQELTVAQKNSLRQLVSYLQVTYPQLKKVKGHSDLSGYEWKDCPCFDYAAVLRGQNGNSIHSVSPTSPQAVTGETGIAYIEGDCVNLRKGPGTGYGIIRQLGKGESYKVWGQSNRWLNLGGDQWVYNDSSYIRYTGESVPTTSQPSNAGVGVVTITADVLRVRTGPGTNYGIVKNVYQGEKYQAWGYKNGWYNVGGDQWVSGEYVKFKGGAIS